MNDAKRLAQPSGTYADARGEMVRNITHYFQPIRDWERSLATLAVPVEGALRMTYDKRLNERIEDSP